MRTELEQIEKIERYLIAEMPQTEQLSFETELSQNSSLKKDVEAQGSVMEAIKRVGLKGVAAGAYSAWIIRKWILRGGIALVIAGGIFAAIQFWPAAEEDCVPCESYETVESSDAEMPDRPENCCEEEKVIDNVTVPSGIIETGEAEVNDTLNAPEEDLLDEIEHSYLEIDENGNFVNQIEADRIINQNPSLVDVSNDEKLRAMWTNNQLINGKVDKEPAFPGGQKALEKYLQTEMKYPEGALVRKVEGVVYISFIIFKTGSVGAVEVTFGVDRELDAEAIRVIKNMPKWKPGETAGVARDLRYSIPVTFAFSME